MAQVKVTSPDELLAALPHVLGFTPTESVVTVPLGSELPVARIDIPKNAEDRREVARSLQNGYVHHVGRERGMLALVCVTEDRRAARATSEALADAFDRIGVDTPLRLWATSDRWTDLSSGKTGPRSVESVNRMAAEAAFHGRLPPAASRAALAEALIGDPMPVAAALGGARTLAQQIPAGEQHAWAAGRLAQFHEDGRSLSDPEAARMLVALESKPTRDVLWVDMSRGNSAQHVELWSDLTRRAPDEVRAPAASMLAFAHWLHGEGAQAWVALDRIPPDTEPYTMAALTATMLERGAHPDVWEDAKATLVDSEAFVPGRPGQGPGRAMPTSQPAPDRRAPGI
ncbi:protein of unknown function (DUF4192) [Brevibacterium sp. Mu109]|uniref:DUF4192 domain-containing protein n=1 Tax=Brevibacterium sp. Mu109 TaxID=1255669 RepID=UPI000C51E3EE|nr:DUF4192 domain-containing protein [Brevibacterium sp. Mu109]MDN5893959.1 DUF4192 domain-containing protein [Nocardioides sp.]SMX86942.1 protein of unknown function (DUF4192) [Brevibacterium sp. Mu109]